MGRGREAVAVEGGVGGGGWVGGGWGGGGGGGGGVGGGGGYDIDMIINLGPHELSYHKSSCVFWSLCCLFQICKKKTSYGNDEPITEYKIIVEKNSSTALMMIYESIKQSPF